MSETTFEYSEIRTSYTDFMNAYEKIRKTLKLNDGFFRGRLFSTVLSDIRTKFIESESDSSIGIKNVVSTGELDSGFANDKGESSASDDSDQFSGSTLGFAGFLFDLLGTFHNYDITKQYRIIVFLVCQKIPLYSDTHEAFYQKHFKSDSIEDIFENIWKEINIRDLVFKITEMKMWPCKLSDLVPSCFDTSLALGVFIELTFFDFFKKYVRCFSEPSFGIFPYQMSSNGFFYCSLKDWIKIKNRLKYEMKVSCSSKPDDNDFFVFQNPILVTNDDNGDILGNSYVDDTLILVGYSKLTNKNLAKNSH